MNIVILVWKFYVNVLECSIDKDFFDKVVLFVTKFENNLKVISVEYHACFEKK